MATQVSSEFPSRPVTALAIALALTDPSAQASVQAAMDVLQPVNLLEVAFPGTTTRSQIRAGTIASDCSAAIKATIDAQMALGRKVFYLPDGLYLASGTRAGIANSLLFVRDGMALLGAPGATIKVADGYNAGGDYSIMASESNADTSNVIIDGVTFDSNGDNNLVSIGQTRGAYSIKVYQGSHIRIQNCRFLKNPGRNVIVCGNNANPPSCKDVEITNNKVLGFGVGVSGNVQNDGSAFYMQIDGGKIIRNHLENPSVIDTALTCVALEIHGRNTLVADNTVINFTSGGNAVAQVHDNEHSTWERNKFRVSKIVFTYFALGGCTLRDLKVLDNTFELDFGSYAPSGHIYQGRGLTGPTTPEDVLIDGNTLYCATTTALAQSWSGIDVIAGKGLTIGRNKFRNVQCSGILLNNNNSNQEGGFDRVLIEDNDIDNCGLHVAATEVWAVHVKNGGVTATVSIASPGVVTWASHPFSVGSEFVFDSTTGALPTGLTVGTVYFVQNVVDVNSFTLSATRSGAAINTSGTQSGVHTAVALGRVFKNITIRANRIGKDTYSGNMRGTKVDGPGIVDVCLYKGDNETTNIPIALRYATGSTTRFQRVVREARIVMVDRTVNGGLPEKGFFEAGGELVQTANPASGSVFVRRPSTDGAASSGTWAASTLATRGVWWKGLANGSIVAECIQSGNTGGSEPTWPGVGNTVTDGDAQWVQRATTAAAFASGYTFP